MLDDDSKPLFHFYIDDSGTRHPDKLARTSTAGDWFGLGGLLIKEEDEDTCRDLHRQFCEKWQIDYPLHSVKIRHKSDDFSWMATLPQPKLREFFSDIESMIHDMPFMALACVIDRPGYRDRYLAKYGRQSWQLCKTAFTVICERAAKFSFREDRRIKLFVERTDKNADRAIKAYYDELRSNGMPFSKSNSSKYNPLSAEELRYRLLDLKLKKKSSPMIQMADLLLYPVCRSPYDEMYAPHKQLKEADKLIDCLLSEEEAGEFGIKYSCFN